MPHSILYLDIETSLHKKILDIGALLNTQEFHSRDLGRLQEWIIEAQYICGHNIIEHDIPILKCVIPAEHFKDKIYIDTLLWSPILFSNNPYHKLVKAYKIVNESDINNPLSDCKLTKQLLSDELNAFNALDSNLQQIIAFLLTSSESYSGFLEVLNFKKQPIDVHDKISKLLDGKICSNIHIAQLYWYDAQDEKEYKIVLPRVRFEKKNDILGENYK